MQKKLFLILFFSFLFLPQVVFGAVEYKFYVVVGWTSFSLPDHRNAINGSIYPDYDLYVKTPKNDIYHYTTPKGGRYSNVTKSGESWFTWWGDAWWSNGPWCGPRSKNPPEGLNAMSATEIGTYKIEVGEKNILDCPIGIDDNLWLGIEIKAKTDIFINGFLYKAGQTYSKTYRNKSPDPNAPVMEAEIKIEEAGPPCKKNSDCEPKPEYDVCGIDIFMPAQNLYTMKPFCNPLSKTCGDPLSVLKQECGISGPLQNDAGDPSFWCAKAAAESGMDIIYQKWVKRGCEQDHCIETIIDSNAPDDEKVQVGYCTYPANLYPTGNKRCSGDILQQEVLPGMFEGRCDISSGGSAWTCIASGGNWQTLSNCGSSCVPSIPPVFACQTTDPLPPGCDVCDDTPIDVAPGVPSLSACDLLGCNMLYYGELLQCNGCRDCSECENLNCGEGMAILQYPGQAPFCGSASWCNLTGYSNETKCSGSGDPCNNPGGICADGSDCIQGGAFVGRCEDHPNVPCETIGVPCSNGDNCIAPPNCVGDCTGCSAGSYCGVIGTKFIGVPCGIPQTVSADTGCLGGVNCTITVNFPGTCAIEGGCEPPTFDQVCTSCDGGGGGEGNNPGPDPDPGPGDNPPVYPPGALTTCSPYNQCVPDGGGKECTSNLDCQIGPRCEGGKCTKEGTGIACLSDQECERVSTSCDENNKCVPGGIGRNCEEDYDCQKAETRCTIDGQCTIYGTGLACDNVTDCRMNQKGCSGFLQCAIGGGGKSCSNNAECDEAVTANYTCDEYFRCVPGGITGIPCYVYSALQDCKDVQSPRCNEFDQCKADGSGRECRSGFECQNEPSCNSDMQCVENGGGIACGSDEECENTDFSCNEHDQCVPGGGDNLCDFKSNGDSECQSGPRCNEEGKCVDDDSAGVTCEEGPTCTNYLTSCKGIRCVPGGGGALCLVPEDCQEGIPYAYGLQVTEGPPCTGMAGGVVIFGWSYANLSSGEDIFHQMQISTDEGFNNIIFDTGMVAGTGKSVQKVVLPKLSHSTDACAQGQNCSYINYQTDYYWRVKVLDLEGQTIDWVNYEGAYAFSYPHPAPTVVYDISDNVALGEPIDFIDFSRCYEDDGTPYACSGINPINKKNNGYTWIFGDFSSEPGNEGTVYTIGSTKHIYRDPKTYISRLKVCDDIACCISAKSILLGTEKSKDLPFWKEWSPF